MEDWNEKLTTAARDGDIEALKLSLQNGADIDYRDMCEGETALMLATRWGHLEICRLLIDRGCKMDITDVRGRTALMKAAGRGRLEICSLLIDRGCKIDITDGSGVTALMRAALNGYLEICRLLIGRGCKTDITDKRGYTALHWAAENGYLQITRCLVERGGASLLVTTHKGKTPYDLAAEGMEGQYKEVMEYLQTVMSEKSSGVTAGQGREDTKLDFSDILDQMMTKLVISVDDRRTIEQNDDQEKKLFSIMIERGEPNKSVCIDVLKQNSGYKDLTEKLSVSPSAVPPPTKTDLEDVPDYKIRLQKNYLEIINTLTHNT